MAAVAAVGAALIPAAAGASTGTARAATTATAAEPAPVVKFGLDPAGMAIDPTTGTLWAESSDNRLTEISEKTNRVVRSMTVPGAIQPNSGGIAVDQNTGVVWVVNPSNVNQTPSDIVGIREKDLRVIRTISIPPSYQDESANLGFGQFAEDPVTRRLFVVDQQWSGAQNRGVVLEFSETTGRMLAAIPVTAWQTLTVTDGVPSGYMIGPYSLAVNSATGVVWAAGTSAGISAISERTGRIVASVNNNYSDSLAVDDSDGSLWASGGNAILEYSHDGKLEHTVPVAAPLGPVDPATRQVFVLESGTQFGIGPEYRASSSKVVVVVSPGGGYYFGGFGPAVVDPRTGDVYFDAVSSAFNDASFAYELVHPAFFTSRRLRVQPGRRVSFTIRAKSWPTAVLSHKGSLPRGLKILPGRQGSLIITGVVAASAAHRSYALQVTAASELGTARQRIVITVT
jgi:hypothetical protein